MVGLANDVPGQVERLHRLKELNSAPYPEDLA